MQTKIHVVAHIHAAPGYAAAVQGVLESLILPTRGEAGCLVYDFYVDVEDESKFTFVEEWTSAEALKEHLNSPHLTGAQAQLADKLATEPWIQVLRAR